MQTLLLCLKILLARILDVSIGVIRTVELVKDNTFKAVVLAFFEVLIWFLVAKEALNTKDFNIIIAIFYSLGYALGTLFGSFLSKKLIRGSLSVQVISSNISIKDINYIKSEGYGITKINLDNKRKKMLLLEVNKKRLNNIINLIKSLDRYAFITVSESKYIENGYVK